MAIIDVIKYEGRNNVLVWKHPKEDFNTSAQLIVHKSQEAIIYKDGVPSRPYTAGKYTIETENLPVVRKFVGLVTGGVSPNHYEVYYINKAYAMEVHWGTTLLVQDTTVQVPFDIQARGQFAVRVENSATLMEKLIGTSTSLSTKSLQDYFRGILLRRIKSFITNVMIEKRYAFSEMNSHLNVISETLEPQLADVFTKYGLALEEFNVESIEPEKNDTYETIKKAEVDRATQNIVGVTKKEEMSFDVAKTQAANTGTSGNFANMMAGMTAGAAVAPVIGGIMHDVAQPASSSSVVITDQFKMGVVNPRKQESTKFTEKTFLKCPNCGEEVPEGSLFCNHCGKKINVSVELTCPVCGSKLPLGSNFCNACGSKV